MIVSTSLVPHMQPPKLIFGVSGLHKITCIIQYRGIPFVSKHRKQRIEAIAKHLSLGEYNIVCLQEVWSENDYFYLSSKVKDVLPFSHYFYSGVLGSGICIFSFWKIDDVFFYQWSLNGYIHKIQHGDWFGGKGVGLCRINCNGFLVNVYSSHLHAEYNTNDMYFPHRVLQSYSTAEFVKLTSATADLVILAGDFNIEPGSLAFRLICEIASLIDPGDVSVAGDLNKAINPLGTSETADNSYTDTQTARNFPNGKRIDHIMYRVSPKNFIEITSLGNPLPDRIPDKSYSYSDHNAVSLSMIISRRIDKGDLFQQNIINLKKSLQEAEDVCKDAISSMFNTRRTYTIYAMSIFLLLLSTVGYGEQTYLFHFIRILITAAGLYFIVMASLWNRIELNSLKAGLIGIQTSLNNCM